MLISLTWIRELLPMTAPASEVSRRLTSRGLTVDAVTDEDGDTIFDLDVPANRPDALGHLGVAREIAAAFGLTLHPPAGAPPGAAGADVAASLTVTIEAPDRCRRYTARIVRGVKVGPSPDWVVKRLAGCGVRAINNVVDVSNLVMLGLGQPVHFFDLATIAGPEIRVRPARPGERLKTLDGVDRTLDPSMLVIADAKRAVGLAGVIGGADTEIRESTKDVLIEAAWFAPASVRKTSRALSLSTDASQRFERGCDLEAPQAAQEMAVRLLAEIAGGTPAPGMIDVRPAGPVARTLSVRLSRASRVLGFAPAADEAKGALAALALAPRMTGDVIEVTVPSWRVDLEREADLIEEIGRHLGYDRIPAVVPAGAPRATTGSSLEEAARDRLCALGFSEAMSYAMIGAGEDDPFVARGAAAPLSLVNPIAETLGVLRRSLLPGLLRSADQNLRRGAEDVRLFEVGGVFSARAKGELPHEPSHAGFAWSGSATPAHWSGSARPADPWDAAGLIEDLLAMAAGDRSFRREPSDLPGLHPGRSLSWRDDAGRPVAWCGPLHPELAVRYGLSAELLVGEADLTAAASVPRAAAVYRPISRLPGAWRDLSLVLDARASAGSVILELKKVASPAPVELVWIDRYAGPPLNDGEVAMTLRVMLQPLDRTLTDGDAENYRAALVSALDSVPGVRLRRVDS